MKPTSQNPHLKMKYFSFNKYTKKSTLLAVFLCLYIFPSLGFAQYTKDSLQLKKGYFHYGFIHPLEVGGKNAKERNYNFSLNILNGYTGSIKGLEFGLINLNKYHVHGFQTGLVNVLQGNSKGIQIGLFTNVNLGTGVGMQLSGLWTFQQKKFIGFQFSWFGNTVMDDMYGAQLSHLSNHTQGDMKGIQFALGPNTVWKNAQGIQMSATINIAKEWQDGVQFGFLGNYAKYSKGIQFGAVNIGLQKSGFQIGLINYSGDGRTAATLGLINIVKHGYNKIELWGGEFQSFNLAFKYGGNKLYSLVSLGTNPFNENKFWTTGWGFGTHITFSKRFYCDIDQVTSLVHINEAFSFGKDKTTIINQVRFTCGFEITPWMAIFIGPVWNSLFSDNNQLVDGKNGIELAPTFRTFYGDLNQFKFAIWPGICGGIRFL